MTKHPLFLYTELCEQHLLETSHGLATGQIMFIPATHSVCLFVATPPSAASILLFFTLHFCESPCRSIFLLFADFLPLLFFVWLYSVNSGHFDLSLLIYIFQYMGWMDILFLLLWFGFRENWRTKGLSEQVFASCYQDFVFFAQEIFTVVHPSFLKESAWWCA